MYNYQMYGNNNQFYGRQMQQPMQSMQPLPTMQTQEQFAQQSQPIFKQSIGLQGKIVDSIEVVKGAEIPLDGSVSYFALADNSAIVTKQLQQDGTSKTIIYKPIESEKQEDNKRYITSDELDEKIKKVDNSSIKDDIKTMKRQIKDLIEDIKDINKDIRKMEE